MVLCESLLLTLLIAEFILCSITDCQSNIISNKTLVRLSMAMMMIDSVYYTAFARQFVGLFLTNMLLYTAIAFFFYCYHLWAAGDSKMLFVTGLGIPARFYTASAAAPFAGFGIIILIFSIALIYVMGESVVLGIKNRNFFKTTIGHIDIKRGVVSYFAMVAAIMLINCLLQHMAPVMYFENSFLSSAINFLVILSLIQIRNKVGTKMLTAFAGIAWAFLFFLSYMRIYELHFSSDYKSWGIVLLMMMLRMFAEKYNYSTIPTSSVKKGQILSAMTIIGFAPSRVKGLPTGTTEDLRSRLTEEEAESVRRWEHSALGKPYVVLVRKIPFAIFISIGTIIFLVIEVLLWHYA